MKLGVLAVLASSLATMLGVCLGRPLPAAWAAAPPAYAGRRRAGSSASNADDSPSTLAARGYYKELYKAGGLDRMADAYACFEDDPKAQAFFIFGKSKDIRDFMMANGTFKKLPGDAQRLLRKDFLIVRGYDKGVPWETEEYLDKDRGSWISKQHMLDKNTPIRIRFTIDWQTLRYKWAVEILKMDSTYRSEYATYGKCQPVPAGIPQRGGEN